jgi:predicted deacylase
MKANQTDHTITIAGTVVAPGERVSIDLPTSPLYTRTPMSIPVHVINGKLPGPKLFITSAVHGDELNGVEIIRRLLKLEEINHLRGTLIAIPIVNIFGFVYRSRYLPDRRDLNRVFPGSKRGSMAARIAYLIMQEIIMQCTHGIDIHTGAIHRRNLPQVRADLKDHVTLGMAKAFGASVIVDGSVIGGSLRSQAVEHKVHTLLYEAGEALRMNEVPIRRGVRGIINVMREIEMLPHVKKTKPASEPFIAHASAWLRANHAGLFVSSAGLGDEIERDQQVAIIADPITGDEFPVMAPSKGIIIGINKMPLVNEGDALLHIAQVRAMESNEYLTVDSKRGMDTDMELDDSQETAIVD